MQLLLFGLALKELEDAPDLTNQVLEVSLDVGANEATIARYELPES